MILALTLHYIVLRALSPRMASHAARLARIFTPEYACRINAQIVHPAVSQLVKANELESALARPLNVAVYEPDRPATYLAATLSYGIINGRCTSHLQSESASQHTCIGHPFLDGNKRTAFFLANEYLRAQGLPGLLDEGRIGGVYQGLADLADRHINVAAGKLDVEGLAGASASREPRQ
ncbi:hypothetical protein C8Q79DRAFT_932467 [Trametes meyenii]|nr:hypothetical protein C8Q79DRAFT_932467 [Trametes meyenii]